ncbi:MAG: hypothetical protein IJX36_04955 [Thermoguttaceae bacterium]|nr:hypothetical protein [Thermoguttaceae bacterium]MBQ9127284.1 hypothetical protein [Thermoguttaceae bacterium]
METLERRLARRPSVFFLRPGETTVGSRLVFLSLFKNSSLFFRHWRKLARFGVYTSPDNR